MFISAYTAEKILFLLSHWILLSFIKEGNVTKLKLAKIISNLSVSTLMRFQIDCSSLKKNWSWNWKFQMAKKKIEFEVVNFVRIWKARQSRIIQKKTNHLFLLATSFLSVVQINMLIGQFSIVVRSNYEKSCESSKRSTEKKFLFC